MIEFVCPQSSEECEPGQVRNEAALSISLLWLGRFFLFNLKYYQKLFHYNFSFLHCDEKNAS